MKDPNDYNVRAVERALQILNSFSDQHPERGISEISQAVDLHKSTTHRIVTTLLNYGFLDRTEDEQRYRLGLQLASLGANVIRRVDARREALPYMTALVKEWDESCDLSIYDQNQVFYIEILRGNHALSIAATVGQRLPAHCTASGKLFLAHMPQPSLDRYLQHPLKQYTNNTITSPEQLRQQLEVIRQDGYALDAEELELGIQAVSAPIYNIAGVMIAAMSITGPKSRMTPDRIRKITPSLQDNARAVSQRIGWKP